MAISSCHAGWNSTSSTRLPKRSWVLSLGGFSLASLPSSIVSARPAISPTARMVSIAKSPPSRETASTSGWSDSKTLWSESGSDWLVTAWVEGLPAPAPPGFSTVLITTNYLRATAR